MNSSIQEDTFYEGGPAKGDLIFNILLGFTLIALPFTVDPMEFTFVYVDEGL